MQDHVHVHGIFYVTLLDPATGLHVASYETSNLVTSAGRNHIAQMLLDIGGYDTGLTYQALGTGTTSPTLRDTTLDTETVRQRIISRGATSSNVATFFTYFAAAQVGSGVEELGVFGHTTARNTVDTGTLFARALLSIDNAGGNDITVSYVLTIT